MKAKPEKQSRESSMAQRGGKRAGGWVHLWPESPGDRRGDRSAHFQKMGKWKWREARGCGSRGI